MEEFPIVWEIAICFTSEENDQFPMSAITRNDNRLFPTSETLFS